MKTKTRLSEAYETAHVLEFDDDSRYVFLSDAHRGDGSMSDEFARNKNIFAAALAHYYDEQFVLVENGDSDDLWEFDYRHILQANRLAFQSIRRFHDAGRYFRLFGNHDIQVRDPAYVRKHLTNYRNQVTGTWEELMPGLRTYEALILRHKVTHQEVLTVHGHQGDFANDQNWYATMWTFRLFWRYLHRFGFQSPSSPIRNSFKRHKVERNYVKWIRDNRVALICGHTHRERFPRGDELPYFNSGSCVFPDYMTGLEIAGGTIALVRWSVEADANAYLHVVRRVVVGPEPLETYDLRNSPESALAAGSTGRRIQHTTNTAPTA